MRYFYKTYEDQTIRVVDLKEFDLDAKKIVRINTRSEQPFVDVTKNLK